MQKYKVNKNKCAGCRACLNACPFGAIEIDQDGKAIINPEKCRGCGRCQRACPFEAIERA
jgi:Fe-S-cluster-containing dehydrogenase component